MQSTCGCVLRKPQLACAHARPAGSSQTATAAMRLSRATRSGAARCEALSRCGGCGGAERELHACLECLHAACGGACVAAHAAATGHAFSVGLAHGRVYCHGCADYVGAAAEWADGARPWRAAQRAWAPQLRECREMGKPATAKACLHGLRGLTNMGNTCFMGCVLQAMVHNPFLRNAFLSDCHTPDTCPLANAPTAEGAEAVAPACLACDMDRLFAEMYSGETQPHTPAYFLYDVWRHAEYLAGYEQQDAHEFLMFLLDKLQLHLSSPAAAAASAAAGGKETPLLPRGRARARTGTDAVELVPHIFEGKMQSKVTCSGCGHTSFSYDPFFDVPLSLLSAKVAAFQGGSQTLANCLRSFTQPEPLNGSSSFTCSKCSQSSLCTKQLSFHRLPLVCTIQLKRFEQQAAHPSQRKAGGSVKIDSLIEFPTETLDLGPFTSSSLHKRKLDAPESQVDTNYELSSVIVHSGQLDRGHYLTYLRMDGDWYRCNDEYVTRVRRLEVARSEAYLLFYTRADLGESSSTT